MLGPGVSAVGILNILGHCPGADRLGVKQLRKQLQSS